MHLPLITEIAYQDPLALFAPWADQPYAQLLESAKKAANLGRYSYIAVDPYATLVSKQGYVLRNDCEIDGHPLQILQNELNQAQTETFEGIPPLQGGVVGYFSYDFARCLEQLPDNTRNDMDFPDMMLGFYDVIVSFDHLERRAWIVSTGLPEMSLPDRLTRAKARLAGWMQHIGQVQPLGPISDVVCDEDEIVSNFNRSGYEAAVSSVIESILNGDIFETCISQRFQTRLPEGLSAFDLYRRLRHFNAAPFASFSAFGDIVIVSASPERFLRVSGKSVETRPIKGTAPRSSDTSVDLALAQALLASEKDRAENIMIVDLMRNDLSRVCRDHSVVVPQLCALESFATVHHLVSVVRGELCEQYGPVDLLRASFPGGSITGAPKVRAMEIIDAIEPHRRGPYCGSIGFIGFNGDMDMSITIRTFALRGEHISFHAGGAIVVDSDPAGEYQETLDKAVAMRRALTTSVDIEVTA
ncbi:MAG: aminodeoxychorismate synthase component I, partial [Pseudomonadota bacterium]|nr:aminodeoxychorismate synthase component I [Pseudomonadota bacterium]